MAGRHLIQISWNGGNIEEIKPYALKYHKKIIESPEYNTEEGKDKLFDSELFFESVASGKPYFGGSKGDMWVWGTIAKFPDMEEFLQQIVPFFRDLWEEEIILRHRTVILFDEYDDEHAKAHMILCNCEENFYIYPDLPLNQLSVIRIKDISELCWRT